MYQFEEFELLFNDILLQARRMRDGKINEPSQLLRTLLLFTPEFKFSLQLTSVLWSWSIYISLLSQVSDLIFHEFSIEFDDVDDVHVHSII